MTTNSDEGENWAKSKSKSEISISCNKLHCIEIFDNYMSINKQFCASLETKWFGINCQNGKPKRIVAVTTKVAQIG